MSVVSKQKEDILLRLPEEAQRVQQAARVNETWIRP